MRLNSCENGGRLRRAGEPQTPGYLHYGDFCSLYKSPNPKYTHGLNVPIPLFILLRPGVSRGRAYSPEALDFIGSKAQPKGRT